MTSGFKTFLLRGNLVDMAVGIVIGIAFGTVVTAVLIAFVIIAAVLYFFVVAPYAKFKARFEPAPVPEPEMKQCPRCLSNIPAHATRCLFCTIDL